MPASFTRTWDASWEAVPVSTEIYNLGAQRLREIKSDIQERFIDEGIFLKELSGDPSNVGASGGDGALYNNSGDLWFVDYGGVKTQITKSGAPYLYDGADYIWGWNVDETVLFSVSGSITVTAGSGSASHGISGSPVTNNKILHSFVAMKFGTNSYGPSESSDGISSLTISDSTISVEDGDGNSGTCNYILVYKK